MKFLIDKSTKDVVRKAKSPLVLGQLNTPLTNYAHWGGTFAIDNGAYSGFREKAFSSLVKRRLPVAHQCLFVAVPDLVGSHLKTLNYWYQYKHLVPPVYRKAFVAQNGAAVGLIPWNEFDWLFIGGVDPWKDTEDAYCLVREAKARNKHVHVGRVNTYERYIVYRDLGADTCDGSGVARYDHMLTKLEVRLGLSPTQFDEDKT